MPEAFFAWRDGVPGRALRRDDHLKIVYFGNESPNIGFPLFDCCSVASS
jgi:hypothetical protein